MTILRMNRLILAVALATVSLVVLQCSRISSTTTSNAGPLRPNIIMIVADDLGFSDLGSYGGEIRTPNLDRLASEGVRWTQFYNNAVCVVTRVSMMTGLYPRFGRPGLLRRNMVSVAEVLKQSGYRTVMTGKWHLGAEEPNRPTDRGFEEYYGVPSGCCNFFNPAMPDPGFYYKDKKARRRPFVHNTQSIEEFPDDFYTTDAFSKHAVENIHRLAAEKAPFFLHLAYTAPHFPIHAKPGDIARYKGLYDPGYFALRRQRYERLKELGLIDARWRLSAADSRIGPWKYDYEIEPWESVADKPRQRTLMEAYAAMVDSLDQGIGRVLEALEQSGASENTLVLFFSDNGGCASLPIDQDGYRAYNRGKTIGGKESYEFVGPGWGWAQSAPFRKHKAWTYEGGIATPLIARWPGKIQAGSVTSEVGHVVDLLPTFVEAAGTAYPARYNGNEILPVEGRSLIPVFTGRPNQTERAVFWHLYGNRAVRQGKWKLVWGVTRGQWELYDMDADRTETNDLASQHAERVREMSARWQEWAAISEVSEDATRD